MTSCYNLDLNLARLIHVMDREMKDKYEDIAIYVDDLLIASEKPQQIIQDLKEKFNSKSKVMDHWNTTLVVTTN